MKLTKILMLLLPVFASGYAKAEIESPRVLVAYYSLTGKTERIAKAIADASGGQLYRIEVAKNYPKDTKEQRAVLEQEIETNSIKEYRYKPRKLRYHIFGVAGLG